jgi:hypothetical protein
MGRRVFLAVLATIFALIAPADAAGAPDRYCLQGSQSDYPGNCQFNSYFQCMNAASGKGAQCRENPKYEFARKRPASGPQAAHAETLRGGGGSGRPQQFDGG